jgi:hypothetical protein
LGKTGCYGVKLINGSEFFSLDSKVSSGLTDNSNLNNK